MREISAEAVADTVARLCVQANTCLPRDVTDGIAAARAAEDWPPAREILDRIVENGEIGGGFPICQDTGMACVFLEVGQELHIAGDLAQAVDEGVRRGYAQGYLRKSVVSDPLERVNSGDNTPAMLYTDLVPGDRLAITVAPKGFGSENMSRLKMFTPSAIKEDIVKFVVETVSLAGSNPCPPIVVGVGIGGDFEYSALLAKKALCRDLGIRHPEPLYAEMEQAMLDGINRLGIGSQGFGGTVTALYVNIEKAPTHIAGLPVAVNIGCHVTRHAECEI